MRRNASVGVLVGGIVLAAGYAYGPLPAGESPAGGTGLQPVEVPEPAPASTIAAVSASSRARLGLPAVRPQLCFAPGTPDEVVAALSEALGTDGSRAVFDNRWSSTATNGGGLAQGQPTTLTYSFAPDGTFCPDITGLGFSGNSDLFAYLNGIYGSPAVWQPLFAQVFARWSEVAGVTYVYEPNDDGSTLNTAPGQLGVRGDVRIAGFFIDGPGNALAYNNFPDDGDMVLDTGDNFFLDTSNDSLILRNVVAHEHGHGLGLRHVCPVLGQKLMEPTLSVSFDGPRHDDIRGANHHYGDVYEPNDSAAAAADVGVVAIGTPVIVGAVPPPAVANGANLSIEETSEGDEDYYRFAVTERVSLTVTVTPVGATYQNNAQVCPGNPSNCCSGNSVNTLNIANLNVEVLDQDGVTVLAMGASAAAGGTETISGLVLPIAGDYYVHVFAINSTVAAQLYTLTLSADAPPFVPMAVSLPSGAPSEVLPDVPASFDVLIVAGDEAITPGSQLLHYRFDGGAFATALLTPAGGDLYTATLPAPGCDDAPEFYVSAVGDTSGQVTFPSDGPVEPLSAIVTSGGIDVLADEFESDLGWTVSGDAVDGHWQRGFPQGNDRGDPAADADGSGQCYLTEIDPFSINSDVDDGTTTLTSPVFDFSDGGTIAFDYWLNDAPNGRLNGDALTVEVATDPAGTNWTLLRTYTTALGEWRSDVIEVDTEVSASATVRIRFNASDLGVQNVVECGVDAFIARTYSCESSATCSDGIQNQGENRIDCGGPCAACACTTDATCDDGLFCTGAETCDAFGECQPAAFSCGAGEWCDEAADACVPHGDGDFDGNGTIDLFDYAMFQECFGQPADLVCAPGNLIGTDGTIDAADFMAFVDAFTGL